MCSAIVLDARKPRAGHFISPVTCEAFVYVPHMRLFTGDELGNTKAIRCTKAEDHTWKFEEPVVHSGNAQSDGHRVRSVEKLAATRSEDQTLVRTVFLDMRVDSAKKCMKQSSLRLGRMAA